MKRMHLKKRKSKKNKVINIILLVLILLIISIIYVLKIFNDKALPQLLSYSEIEIQKIVTSVISSTVTREIANDIDIDDLFITSKDTNDDIKSIDFNTKSINTILSNTTDVVEESLKYLETGQIEKLRLDNVPLSFDNNLKNGIIYEVPSGIIFNNVLLNNIFPKIPVKIDLIGNIFCRLNTDVSEYGINNALIKVNINIEVEIKILLPFVSSNSKINVDVPILMKLMEGNVPSYYFDGYLGSPSVTNKVE